MLDLGLGWVVSEFRACVWFHSFFLGTKALEVIALQQGKRLPSTCISTCWPRSFLRRKELYFTSGVV